MRRQTRFASSYTASVSCCFLLIFSWGRSYRCCCSSLKRHRLTKYQSTLPTLSIPMVAVALNKAKVELVFIHRLRKLLFSTHLLVRVIFLLSPFFFKMTLSHVISMNSTNSQHDYYQGNSGPKHGHGGFGQGGQDMIRQAPAAWVHVSYPSSSEDGLLVVAVTF